MNAAAQPLADLLENAGGRLDTRRGATTVLHFGEAAAELAAARGEAALIWHPARASVRVAGSDRLAFLHRLLTARIEGRVVGERVPSLLLDPKGHVMASLDLALEAEDVRMSGDASAVADAATVLSRYVLRSDVRIESVESAILRLHGPAAPAVAAAVGLPAPTAGRGCTETIDGQDVAIGWQRTMLDLEVPWATAPTWWSRLTDAGARPAGHLAAEAIRIAGGRPAHGAEITGAEFPQELRLEDAVDFDKGCYLGQETVARIHFRGHVNRLLCTVQLDAPGEPGVSVSAGSREAGQVTSVAAIEGGDAWALALLRREAAEPGTELVVGQTAGRVLAVPSLAQS